jgi:hypothetical protein
MRAEAGSKELNLEQHLTSLDRFAAYYTSLAGARCSPRAVRSSRRQLSSANRCSSSVAKSGLVGHGVSVLSNLAALELPRGIAEVGDEIALFQVSRHGD